MCYTPSMPDFAQTMADAPNIPEKEQKALGKADAGKMTAKHEDFIKLILKLIDDKKIDPLQPESFLNKKVYDSLSDGPRAKTDLALLNMANQLQHIVEFRLSKHTPDESPQLESMIEHLWEMKDRVEQEAPHVFVF